MQFNSPKNFKRGRLINNRYRPIDLVIAGITITITMTAEMIYLLALNGKHVAILVALTIPAMIGICLLIPFEIYHNPIEMIKLFFIYVQTPKKYIWEGIYKRDVLQKPDEDE
ncbi:MAG: hypothetical protein IKG37_02345 [Solobacterium sp.]|jgi:hypothetical protein|nr:hypothetical protein [Solobacterium sp.]